MVAPVVQFDSIVPGSSAGASPGFEPTQGPDRGNPIFSDIQVLNGERQDVVPLFGNRDVSTLNKAAGVFQNRLTFQYDKGTGRIVAKLIDPESGKEVKQIPTQEALDAAFRFEKIRGILFDGSH